MVMFGGDFGPLAAGPQAARRGPEALALDRGVKRSWLKVFETLSPQVLNSYGPAPTWPSYAPTWPSYGPSWLPFGALREVLGSLVLP